MEYNQPENPRIKDDSPAIVFRDGEGKKGMITKSLSVEYNGYWRTDVKCSITRIEHKHCRDETLSEKRCLFNDVLVDLNRNSHSTVSVLKLAW